MYEYHCKIYYNIHEDIDAEKIFVDEGTIFYESLAKSKAGDEEMMIFDNFQLSREIIWFGSN